MKSGHTLQQMKIIFSGVWLLNFLLKIWGYRSFIPKTTGMLLLVHHPVLSKDYIENFYSAGDTQYSIPAPEKRMQLLKWYME